MSSLVGKLWPWLAIVVAFALGIAIGRPFGAGDRATAGGAVDHVRSALELPRGIERTRRYVTGIEAMGEGDARAIADLLEADLTAPNQHEIRLFAGEWARTEPDAALDRVLRWQGDPTARVSAGSEVLQVWARNRPLEARQAYQAWSAQMGKDVGRYASALALGWIDSGLEPDGLVPFLAQLKDWDRERATRVLLDRLVEQGDPQDAFTWAEALPDDLPHGYRHLVFRKIALVIGPNDPLLVAQWLEPSRMTRYGQAGFRILARTWANHDPEAALAWAIDQPDDRARFLSVKFGFERWYENDPTAARAWLEHVAAGTDVDAAYLMIGLLDAGKDPVTAAQAALQIEDTPLLLDTLAKVLRQWRRVDSQAANAWFASDEVPDEVRQALLAPANRTGASGSRVARDGEPATEVESR